MTITEFKERATQTKFNTCNGWGFGGGVGTEWRLGCCILRKGSAYFRHTPSQRFETYTVVQSKQENGEKGGMYHMMRGEGKKALEEFESYLDEYTKLKPCYD